MTLPMCGSPQLRWGLEPPRLEELQKIQHFHFPDGTTEATKEKGLIQGHTVYQSQLFCFQVTSIQFIWTGKEKKGGAGKGGGFEGHN